jgi:hypothetical protein
VKVFLQGLVRHNHLLNARKLQLHLLQKIALSSGFHAKRCEFIMSLPKNTFTISIYPFFAQFAALSSAYLRVYKGDKRQVETSRERDSAAPQPL